MVYSEYKKQRILHYYFQGFRAPAICRLLEEEKLRTTREGIAKFLKKYQETGCVARRPGSGPPSKVTAEMKAFVEAKMREDDETTAHQLHVLLQQRGFDISLRTVLRCRTSLGWTFRGSAYCQLIRDANKVKRKEWAERHLDETFDDVVWTDECTIQLETHRRFSCHKRGEQPRPKPRYATFIFCASMHIHVYMYMFVLHVMFTL